MLPLATCEPEVDGAVLAIGLGVAAAYLAALWAAVLRGPPVARWRALLTLVLAILLGVVLYAVLQDNEAAGIVAGLLAGALLGVAVWRIGEGVHILRLVGAGLLGAALLPAGFLVLITVAFGGGFTCFS